MVLSETKSALMITNPDLFSICFFGRLDFFFSGDITKNFGQHDSGFGRDDYRATWQETFELLSQDKKREVYLIHFNKIQKAL